MPSHGVPNYPEATGDTTNFNGTGIDPDILQRGRQGHFGLQNMRERAARIIGKSSVESSRGSGTVITLTVPGGIIYRTVNT